MFLLFLNTSLANVHVLEKCVRRANQANSRHVHVHVCNRMWCNVAVYALLP